MTEASRPGSHSPIGTSTASDQASSHTLELPGGQTVSTLLSQAPDPFACLVLAHGAGAGMRHAFMAAIAEGLARRSVSVLRCQFRYMEARGKRPDPLPLAHAAVRAAIATAAELAGSLPLFAGGKSFGARMTSQAQTAELLPGVRGLVCFGFPLHSAGKPSIDRARHLDKVSIPIMFLQATRDTLAEIALLEALVAGFGAGVTLLVTPDVKHSVHVPARSGMTDAQVMEGLLDDAVSGCVLAQRADRPPALFRPPWAIAKRPPVGAVAGLVERITFPNIQTSFCARRRSLHPVSIRLRHMPVLRLASPSGNTSRLAFIEARA